MGRGRCDLALTAIYPLAAARWRLRTFTDLHQRSTPFFGRSSRRGAVAGAATSRHSACPRPGVDHTSVLHPWFQRALLGRPQAAASVDFTSGADETGLCDARCCSPLRSSNWEWNEVWRGRFLPAPFPGGHQPDLNYANPEVQRRSAEGGSNFWLDMGARRAFASIAVPLPCSRAEGSRLRGPARTHAFLDGG